MTIVVWALVALVAYRAYLRYGWLGAAGAVAAYFVIAFLYQAFRGMQNKREAVQILNHKLSDGEKFHLQDTQALQAARARELARRSASKY